MASILEIRAMGSILERKGRGRIWNNDTSSDRIDPKKKKKLVLIDREGKIDGRTKAYREHRKKLEQARQKRETAKQNRTSKFIETIKKKTVEMSYGPAYSRSGMASVRPVASLNASKKKKK